MKNLAIIGGGPAALMLAAQIDTKKYRVTIYDKNKAVGRKFLVAGDGGLNLTYSSTVDDLVSQYSPSEFMDSIIRQFDNKQLMDWFNDHGVATYIGSSNRVFPDAELKPIEVLNKIVDCVTQNNVAIEYEKTWVGWGEHGDLEFDDGYRVSCDVTVFSMGGASWRVTGSDGKWRSVFEEKGVKIEPFRAANCAFSVGWDENFIDIHQGKPLKNIAMSYDGLTSKGELVVTRFGLEGNAIYALSEKIQNALSLGNTTVVYLDLKPTMTEDQILYKYKKSQCTKVTDVLREDINLDRASIGLLKQFSDRDTYLNPEMLAELIKAVPIVIQSADGLDKAISSLGGIAISELDGNFQLKQIPHSYAIGEMVDWYAPTGGYLLQGCFSMGYVLAEHLNAIG